MTEFSCRLDTGSHERIAEMWNGEHFAADALRIAGLVLVLVLLLAEPESNGEIFHNLLHINNSFFSLNTSLRFFQCHYHPPPHSWRYKEGIAIDFLNPIVRFHPVGRDSDGWRPDSKTLGDNERPRECELVLSSELNYSAMCST